MEIFLYYILPIIIFAVIALCLGFLLEFLGVKLAPERDSRIDEVNKLLAGANCGGCGYPGCEAFAKALVEGEAELSSCNPTEMASKEKIGGILGIESLGEPMVAVVHCNGGKNCETKRYQGYGNCVSANIVAGGNKMCPWGCMNLGSCSDSCGFYAINANNDKEYAEVKRHSCTACGACVKACPKGLTGLIPRKAKIYVACSSHDKMKDVTAVCKVGCIACGVCAKACPHGAIEMVDNLAVIDYSKCDGCLTCAVKCPTKVIKVIE